MCLDILESYILNWEEKIWHLILTKRPNSDENHSLEKIFMCLFIWRTKWHGVERETNIWSAGSLPKYQNTKIARSGPTWSQEPETTWSLPCNGRSASTPKCLWWNWLGSWQYSAMWCVCVSQAAAEHAVLQGMAQKVTLHFYWSTVCIKGKCRETSN